MLVPHNLTQDIVAPSSLTPIFCLSHLTPLPLELTYLNIEYLYLPAVRTQYASEFGHLIRIISIYAKMECTLDEVNG